MSTPLDLAPRNLALGFIAGAISVVVFHQTAILVLHLMRIVPSFPWSTVPTQPFGVPVIVSTAFFGGLWGIALVAFRPLFPARLPFLSAAFIFGALATTLVGWFIVAPLKGQPMAGGFVPARMMIPLIVNGVWGLGAALILLWLHRLKTDA